MAKVTAEEQRRREQLRLSCVPFQAGSTWQFQFSVLGLLPHGEPLHADYSTLCHTCRRVVWPRDINTEGNCAVCMERIYAARVAAERERTMTLQRDALERQERRAELARYLRAIARELEEKRKSKGRRALAIGGLK